MKQSKTLKKDIEKLDPNDSDYQLIEEAKKENNPSYTLEQTKEKLFSNENPMDDRELAMIVKERKSSPETAIEVNLDDL